MSEPLRRSSTSAEREGEACDFGDDEDDEDGREMDQPGKDRWNIQTGTRLTLDRAPLTKLARLAPSLSVLLCSLSLCAGSQLLWFVQQRPTSTLYLPTAFSSIVGQLFPRSVATLRLS